MAVTVARLAVLAHALGAPALLSGCGRASDEAVPAPAPTSTSTSTLTSTTTTTSTSSSTSTATSTATWTSNPTSTRAWAAWAESAGIVLYIAIGTAVGFLCCFFVICWRRLRQKLKRGAGAAATPVVAWKPQLMGASSSTSSGKAGAKCEISATGVTIIEEEEQDFDKVVRNNFIPDYWTNKHNSGLTSFDQMIYSSREVFNIFEDLLGRTHRMIATQDRPCPNKTCGKQRGGCPCVQPGGTPGMPIGYAVRRIIRVEDSGMLRRYLLKKEKIRAARDGRELEKTSPPVESNQVEADYDQALHPLEDSLNEVYLWHGTFVRAALSIAARDFNVDLSGTNAGTMYGRGVYLSENSSKADEYAKDEPGGYYDGIYSMLLCRVCMGNFYYTEGREEEAGAKSKSGEYDSTIGDRRKAVGTFREFVVYDANQVYPEYVVLYTRIYRGDDEEQLRENAKVDFHMELPVYWNNVAANPKTEKFNYQYRVRKATKDLLQGLVSGSTSALVPPMVVDVRRVEDSTMWNRYVEFKTRLRKRVDTDGAFPPPNVLDGDESSGHVITTQLMERLDRAEDAVSVENLDASVNEFLLWHGTSPEAAEAISTTGFRIARRDAKHGKRFGEGGYLAEELEKSLAYTKKNSDDTCFVLLCRATCGQLYYTEDNSEASAHETARRLGMESILANPGKRGPREFIVLEACQVYPEFIVELRLVTG